MKKSILLAIILLGGLSVFSQVRRPNRGVPNQPYEPTEREIEKQKQKMEERMDEFINNFLSTLEADEFQKEIVKQSLNSYFEKKGEIFKAQYERSIERIDAVKELDETHFKDIEGLISEDDMGKIKELIKGEFDEKEAKKKRKKKKKN
jgi:hypothetical protein